MPPPFCCLPDMTTTIDTLVDDARRAYGEGRHEEALRLCEQLVEKAPDRPEGHNIAGKVALDRSEFGRALALFERAQALILTTSIRPGMWALPCSICAVSTRP